ncbi:MAG: STAS domain-containing protein [Thermoleophilaceae bacterium]
MSGLAAVSIEQRDDVVIARVTGELDIAEAGDTGERITEAVAPTAKGVVIDFSELEFIDSSGVAMLFSLARKLDVSRQELRVVAPAEGLVARVLEIVEFRRAAPVDPDLDEALGQIGKGERS